GAARLGIGGGCGEARAQRRIADARRAIGDVDDARPRQPRELAADADHFVVGMGRDDEAAAGKEPRCVRRGHGSRGGIGWSALLAPARRSLCFSPVPAAPWAKSARSMPMSSENSAMR